MQAIKTTTTLKKTAVEYQDNTALADTAITSEIGD